jgi:hypothetical protein
VPGMLGGESTQVTPTQRTLEIRREEAKRHYAQLSAPDPNPLPMHIDEELIAVVVKSVDGEQQTMLTEHGDFEQAQEDADEIMFDHPGVSAVAVRYRRVLG